jgi:ADP-ribosyl-[dinitrogen reductase] hydrolase
VDDKFQGNGSLMRVAPLALLDEDAKGVYHGEFTSGLKEIIETQAKMTHGHHYCYESDLVLVAALKSILQGSTKEQAYQAALQSANGHSKYIHERLLEVPQISWDSLKSSGFCVDTLCAAMWAFLKYDNLEDALVAVVNRGDDSDSCGAVAGALCGAYYGAEAIPERWLNTLEFRLEIQKTLAEKEFNLLG